MFKKHIFILFKMGLVLCYLANIRQAPLLEKHFSLKISLNVSFELILPNRGKM